MRRSFLLITMSILCVVWFCLNAQTGNFYSTDNGLSSSLINSVYQDSRKYIWIATEDGLNKFDGVHFTIYHNISGDKTSLKNNYVCAVFEDSKKRLWIGCINGLQQYNQDEDNFTEVPIYYKNKRISPHITAIIETSNGEIWMSTSGIGIIRSNDNGKTFKVDENLFSRISSRYLISIYQDNFKQIWIGSVDNGISVLNPKTNQVQSFRLPFEAGSGPVSCVIGDTKGSVFVGTLTGGLFHFNKSTLRFNPVNYSNSSNILPIRCLSYDKHQQLIVGTDGKGIKYLNNLSGRLEDYQITSAMFDLSRTKIHALFNDKTGNLWVGLFQKGIFLSPNNSNEFHYIGSKSFYRNTIGSSSVASLFQDKQGQLCVGTDNDGLYIVSSLSSKHYDIKSNKNGISGTIMSVIGGDPNTLWLGSYTDGLIRFNKQTGGITFYKNNTAQNTTLANRALCLAKDANNKIWMGTNGAGIQIFDVASQKFSNQLLFNEKDSSGIANNWVNCIVNDGDSMMWIGTYEGASSINLRTWKIKTYRTTNNYLAGNIVLSIIRDSRGLVWFGTTEGLTCYHPSTDISEHFTSREGLAGNFVCGILEDKKGNLWISTHEGISNLLVSKKHFINYNAHDGLQGNEFSSRAAFKSPTGEMFFGGTSGITSFYPSQISEYKSPVNIYATRLYIFDKLVVKGFKSGGNVVIDQSITNTKEIRLGYKDNMFSIEFSTFDFGMQGSVYYRYKLEGLSNSNWMNTEKGMNRIAFSNLNYGHYTLHVKACVNGLESKEKTIDIIISPPWYLSLPAKIIYFILFLLIIWGIYRIVQERINHKHELIRRENQEQINEGKLQFFINISHEIRTPMSLIISPLEKLLSENTDSSKQEVYRLMYRNAQRILRLINQLLDVRKIDKGQMFIKMRETNIVSFIDDLMRTFEYQAQRHQIQFRFEHKLNELNAWIDVNNFDKVLVNILSNAFKFTPEKGEIIISLNTGTDENNPKPELRQYFEIIVSDNGIGIEETKIEKIFERFYQIDNDQTKVNFGTGIGLHLAKNIVELMHGNIFARNKVGVNGCEFIIRLPLGCDHLTVSEKEDISLHPGKLPISREDRKAETSRNNDKIKNEDVKNQHKVRSKTKYKVLIVDDEDEIRQYLKNELCDTYKIAESHNGKEALEYILREKPDLVISDVMMPEMDGITLCKKIKSNFNIHHIPIILLTAKTSDEDKAEGFDIGADAYVGKPFNIDLLKKRIANIISNRERLVHKAIDNEENQALIKPVVLKPNDQILLEKIIKIINENISDTDLNVEMLADGVGMSRVHMHRKLKELTNMSARDFIRSIRMKQAAELLSSQKIGISELAYALGFSNLSHFSNSFHEFYGMSPREYAAQNMNKAK